MQLYGSTFPTSGISNRVIWVQK